jgi:hypothetical protein
VRINRPPPVPLSRLPRLYVAPVTVIDWAIVLGVISFAAWGYQQGLVVGLFTLIGFSGGALLGSRIGPELLAGGSSSPYSPLTALVGAMLLGGMVAVAMEALALGLRARLVRGPIALTLDGSGGAILLGVLGLGLAWLLGAVALHSPGTRDLRQTIQRSLILQRLNTALPPSGPLLHVLNRIDPSPSIRGGPQAQVGAPDPRIARDPDVARAGQSVVKVLGTACGLGVEGSGWIAGSGLVVTNAHVIAGEDDTTVTTRDGRELDATAVHYDPHNDLSILRVPSVGGSPLPLGPPKRGTAGAVLGFPHNGPYRVTAARLGATEKVVSQDSYGRGPVRRRITSLRGRVVSGNSGGPMVDASGRVLTTVFASTTKGRAGGFGVPDEIVRKALSGVSGAVSTGPCAP